MSWLFGLAGVSLQVEIECDHVSSQRNWSLNTAFHTLRVVLASVDSRFLGGNKGVEAARRPE